MSIFAVSYKVTFPGGATWIKTIRNLDGDNVEAVKRRGRRILKRLFPSSVVRVRRITRDHKAEARSAS